MKKALSYLIPAILIFLCGFFLARTTGFKCNSYPIDSVVFIYDSDLIKKCDEAIILNFQLNEKLDSVLGLSHSEIGEESSNKYAFSY